MSTTKLKTLKTPGRTGCDLADFFTKNLITQDEFVAKVKELTGTTVTSRLLQRLMSGETQSAKTTTMSALMQTLKTLGGPEASESSEAPKEVEAPKRQTISVYLSQVGLSSDLERLMKADAVLFDRKGVIGKVSESDLDQAALIYQTVLDGRGKWAEANRLERREILKGIANLLTGFDKARVGEVTLQKKQWWPDGGYYEVPAKLGILRLLALMPEKVDITNTCNISINSAAMVSDGQVIEMSSDEYDPDDDDIPF